MQSMKSILIESSGLLPYSYIRMGVSVVGETQKGNCKGQTVNNRIHIAIHASVMNRIP